MKNRIIFAISTILFIIIGSLIIIFWAEGFQINFTKGTIESTGTFSIKSNPSGAQVYIDNVYKGQTPLSISNLKAGKYDIQVTKANFASWKSIEYIKSEDITYVYPVLFITTLNPQKVDLSGTVADELISPYQSEMTYKINENNTSSLWIRYYRNSLINSGINQQMILNLSSPTILSILNNYNISLPNSMFSPDNSKLLLYTSNDQKKVRYYILKTDQENTGLMSLDTFVDTSLYNNIVWGPDSSYLVLSRQGESILLNLDTQQKIILYQNSSNNVPIFTQTGSNFYFAQNNNGYGLQLISENGIPQNYIPLAINSPITHMLSNNTNEIALSTINGTYLYDIDRNQLLLISNSSYSFTSFSPDGNNILMNDAQGNIFSYIFTNNSVYNLNLNNQDISGIIWHPLSTELLYLAKDSNKLDLVGIDSTGQSKTVLLKQISSDSNGLLFAGNQLQITISGDFYVINEEDNSNNFIF